MIELRELTREKRYALSRCVEPFFVCAKQPRALSPIHTNLVSVYGRDYSLEIWVIITGMLQARRYGNTCFRIPLNKNVYKDIKQHTKQSISYRRLRRLITQLDDDNHITLYKGFWRSDEDSMMSFIAVEPKLLSMVSDEMCVMFGQARPLDLVEVGYNEKYKDEEGRTRKVKRLLPTKGLRGLTEIRREVLEFNTIVSRTGIEILGDRVGNIIYKRSFNRNLNGAGRWYVDGNFQTEKSEDRKTIRINGSPTCEVDFSAMHPSLCFSKAGEKIPDNYDPYVVDIEENVCPKEFRKFCKVALMCILFSESRGEASRAIRGKIDEDKRPTNPDMEYKSLYNVENLVAKVVKGLLEANKKISQFFFSGELWSKLQNIDARICTFVINHFTNKDVCVLPYHDSFVIDSRYKNELIDVMRAAWEHVVGDGGMNFGYDVEFYNKPEFKFETGDRLC